MTGLLPKIVDLNGAMDDLFGDLFEFHQSIKKRLNREGAKCAKGFGPNRVHQPIKRRLMLRFEQRDCGL